MKSTKTILAYCIVGPFIGLLFAFASPFILIHWASDYLTTRNMTPEEREVWDRNREFLSNEHSGHAYDIV
jgi:hypothetical protein